MHALGSHLLMELRDCNPTIRRSLGEVRNALVFAAREAKATIVDISFHERFECNHPSMVEMKRGILSLENVKLPRKVSQAELQAVS